MKDNLNKVYVVQYDEHYENHIYGIYSDKSKAEDAIKKLKSETKRIGLSWIDIYEYELNKP